MHSDTIYYVQSGHKVPLGQEYNLYEKSKKEEPLECACDLRESDLENKTRKIEEEFASLVTIAVKDMESQQISPEDIALYLINRRGLEPVYANSPRALLENRLEEVRQKTTLKAVFIDILSGYYSWFNHDLIKSLIKTFCKEGQNVTRCLAEFEDNFFEYSKERVSEYIEYGPTRETDIKILVLKVDKKWEVVRVEQLIHIQNTVACILKIEKCNLYLRTVQNGCLQMIFLIPEQVAAAVFPLKFPTEQKAALLETGVLQLHCDGYDLQLNTLSEVCLFVISFFCSFSF